MVALLLIWFTYSVSESNPQPNETSEESINLTTKTFTFRELASATKNFRRESLISDGGIGRVYKGTLQSNGKMVAVRQLDRSGTQGSKEFQVEVARLCKMEHQNLVELIGHCADGDQRMLVYEYMSLGSLEDQLFDVSKDKKPLDWTTRMKLALGVAEGLAYLHEKVNPPLIYCSLKSSNILLDDAYIPKLSEYGVAKLLQHGNAMNASPTIVAGYGYCAPECERLDHMTQKSDVYSFGVILLELITGRKAYDNTRSTEEQFLVTWAKTFFGKPKTFPDMVDPLLKKKFPTTSLNQVVGVASMCTQQEPSVRPLIMDAVAALSFLAMAPPESSVPNNLVPIMSTKIDPDETQLEDDTDDDDDSDDDDEDDDDK